MGLIWLTEFTNVNPIKFSCKKFCYVATYPYEPRIPSNTLTLSGFIKVTLSFGGRKWEEVVNCGILWFLMGDCIKIVGRYEAFPWEWLRNGGIIIPLTNPILIH
jgi:hypothetical protein